jgi:benzoyl-CoA reductase/2-hydroxyglutaryl-CoA dehydratase subunit BcrC/BadD/HgdB
LAPFDEAAEQIAGGRWPEALASVQRPVVAVVCNLAPLELIHAAGGVAVRLCAGSCSANPAKGAAASMQAPRDTCQVVKGSRERLAALEAQLGRAPAAVVTPTTCDWKAKCRTLLASGQTVHVLHVARDKSAAGVREEWRRQVAGLAGFLEKQLGCKIKRRELIRSIARYQDAAMLGRRLAEVMKRPDPPIAGADLMLVFNLFYSLPVETWIAWAGDLLDQLNRVAMPPESAEVERAARRPRLLLVGAPLIWPNWQLPGMLEDAGGRIVSDALCSSYRGFSDLVSVDETSRAELVRALADACFLPCSCPCFTPNEEYLWRIENQARDWQVDGAVIHRLKSCYLFDTEAKRLERMFRRLSIPQLTVESDYEAPTAGALQTRVEAFLDLAHTPSEAP